MGKQELASKIAQEVLDNLGGEKNIIAIAYCMTRLRLILSQEVKEIKEKIEKIEGVLGVVTHDNQLQIILGPGRVIKVATELGKLANKTIGEIDEAELRKAERNQKNNTPFKTMLKNLASIFVPLIPALVACGLVMGLNNFFVKLYPAFGETSIGGIISAIAGSVFFAMPILVGVNAAKVFGGNPMIGGALAALLNLPALSKVTIGTTKLVPGRGGVIAVLLVVAFGCIIEKKIRKYMIESLDILLTPLFTVLITGITAIYLLQPFGGFLSDSITTFIRNLMEMGGFIPGVIMAGLWLPLVMTGLHQSLVPIHAELLNTIGYTPLLAIFAMAGAGQVGAAIAIYLKTKSSRLKKTILTGLPVGIMGIGEPLIYGVTLPLGKPFIAACLGGAVGGGFAAYFEIKAVGMGISGLPLMTILDRPLIYLIGILIAYASGFILCNLLGFQDLAEVDE